MQTDVTLKPCPFCCGTKLTPFHSNFLNKEVHAVFCDTCQTEGPHHFTKAEAIAAWNQRADAQGEAVGCYYCRDDQHGVATSDGGFRCPNCKRFWQTHPPAQDVEALVSALERIEAMWRDGGELYGAVLTAREALANWSKP